MSGGIPFLRHLLQYFPHLSKTLELALRLPLLLTLSLQIQELEYRFRPGKLMVRTLAPPHLPDKPRHQVGAQKVGPKHLGVFIEPHQRPCVLPPRGHQVSGTPHLLEPLKDLESFLPALRHIPPANPRPARLCLGKAPAKC